MDSRSKVPFRLQLLFDQERYNQTIDTFHEELKEEHFEQPIFRLMENIPVRILFDSPYKDSRLYMYGLDAVPSHRVEFDENGEIYMRPSSEVVSLYSISDYPLIPGTYLLRVEVEEKTYYAPFAIDSKQVTGEQLQQMRQELEEMMKGLTFDFVHRVYAASPQEKRHSVLPPPLLKKFMILDRHYPYLMSALADLYDRSNFRIQKSYRWTREEQATTLDHVSLRSIYGQAKLPGFVKTPEREVNYNLPENQWIKRIIHRISLFFDEFVEMMAQHRLQVQDEIEELRRYQHQERTSKMLLEKEKELATIEQYIERVDQMERGLNMIASSAWYHEVEMKPLTHIPHVLAADSRYRALYQLYRELHDDRLHISMHPMYTFQWKRTEKLYEMWGFTRILRLLVDHFGFLPRSGWIYSHSQDLSSEDYVIPILPAGERIELVNGDWRLNLVYDGQLPLSTNGTSERDLPLSMGKNNRPDTRIDFYMEEIYAGSLLIDFKYRPVKNFWVQSIVGSQQRYREMDQLIAYVRDSRSNFLYGEKGEMFRQMFDPRPVHEAWAIYAEAREHQRTSHFIEGERLRIIPFNPGDEPQEIANHMENVFNSVKQKMETLKNWER